MLHLRQAPFSLSLIAAIRLLGMVAADERRLGKTTEAPEAPRADLGPEAALEAQIGRRLTRDEEVGI